MDYQKQEGVEQLLEMFQTGGTTLLALINDILDLSKIESGNLSLESAPFDLGALIEDTAQIFAMLAHEKGLDLNTRVHPKVITAQIGDPARLRQVLSDLLGNAIKFTESGEVTLRVNQGAQGYLQFQVSDTGIGIPQNKQEAVFESFTQADSSTTREYGGTGLGLSISRQVVELMGGKIWVESKPGRGSSFFFTAQLQAQDQEIRWNTLPAVEHAKNLKVLVVDDNPAIRLILQEMLSSWGARVTVAADGIEALAELNRARQEDQRYQLVLLDRHMPGMDGLAVAESMKEGEVDPETTVLMLTSNNRSEDFALGQKLRIPSYLVKPLRRSELLQTITAATGQAHVVPPQLDVVPETLAENLRPLNILLAEDYQNNRLLVQSFLKRTPYQLTIAKNGQEAVEMFQAGRYDLVLMDMQMPVLDGYEATKAIRQWEKQQGKALTQIIALTANAMKEDVAKSLQFGCDAHLSKPIRKLELLDAIQMYTANATEATV